MSLNLRYYFYLLVIILTSPWTYLIFKVNFLIGIISLILSFLLLLMLLDKHPRKTILVSFISTFVLLASISLYSGSDKNIFITTPSEVILLNLQRSFYPDGIGKFFANTNSLQLYKYEENFFSNLDLNLYFFAAHPRERAGIKEFNKYLSFMLFFFILGIVSLISGKKSLLVFILFTVTGFCSGFIAKNYILGPILFFPLLNSVLTIGIITSANFLNICFQKIKHENI